MTREPAIPRRSNHCHSADGRGRAAFGFRASTSEAPGKSELPQRFHRLAEIQGLAVRFETASIGLLM
jgi:hypothetical protein